jgi:hypothetical protein
MSLPHAKSNAVGGYIMPGENAAAECRHGRDLPPPACTPPPGKVATAQELHHFMSLTSTEAIRNPND